MKIKSMKSVKAVNAVKAVMSFSLALSLVVQPIVASAKVTDRMGGSFVSKVGQSQTAREQSVSSGQPAANIAILSQTTEGSSEQVPVCYIDLGQHPTAAPAMIKTQPNELLDPATLGLPHCNQSIVTDVSALVAPYDETGSVRVAALPAAAFALTCVGVALGGALFTAGSAFREQGSNVFGSTFIKGAGLAGIISFAAGAGPSMSNPALLALTACAGLGHSLVYYAFKK